MAIAQRFVLTNTSRTKTLKQNVFVWKLIYMSAFVEDKSLRDVIMCRQVKFSKTMSLVRNPVLCNVCFNVFTIV